MKLRVARVILNVEVFADDGDTLTPIPTQPFAVAFKDWAGFDLEEALGPLRQSVESEPLEITVEAQQLLDELTT